MAGDIYVAVSPSTVRTGDAVSGVPGATYAATFNTVYDAIQDVTYGARDLITAVETQYYHVFEDYTEVQGNGGINDSGFASSGAFRLIIECAPGLEHKGILANAIKISFGHNFGTTCTLQKRSIVRNLHIEQTLNGGAFTCQTDGSLGDKLIISSAGQGFKIFTRGALTNSLVTNCGNNGGVTSNFNEFTLRNVHILNTTGNGFHLGGPTASGPMNIENVVILNSSGNDFEDPNNMAANGNANFDYNMSSDGTAPGTNAIINQPIVDPNIPIVSLINSDPHVVPGKALDPTINPGKDLTAEGILTDIDNQPWTSPFGRGCDQMGEFTVPVNITVKNNKTLATVQGAKVFFKAAAGGPLAEGTKIFDVDSDVLGVASDLELPFTAIQPILGKARKGTDAPFFKTGRFEGEITDVGLDLTVFLSED